MRLNFFACLLAVSHFCLAQKPIAQDLSIRCAQVVSKLAIEEKLVSDAFCCTRIDKKAENDWIEALPTGQRAPAKFLAENIRYISNQEFEDSLNAGISRLVAHLAPDDSVVLVVPDKPNSSEIWTTRYAQALNPRLKQATIINFDQIPTYSRSNFPQKGNVYFVNLDDGAYSGDQVGRAVEGIIYRMSRMSSPNLERSHLRVIRAYGTKAALENADRAVTPYGRTERFQPNSRSVIDFGIMVPTISELASSTSPDFQNKIKAFLHEHYWDYGTLVLPFHKLPDHVSFPTNIMDGTVGTPLDKKHPFIFGPKRGEEEPYRQAPFRNN